MTTTATIFTCQPPFSFHHRGTACSEACGFAIASNRAQSSFNTNSLVLAKAQHDRHDLARCGCAATAVARTYTLESSRVKFFSSPRGHLRAHRT